MAKKKGFNKILLVLLIIILLFFIGYFFVPFANNSFLSKIYSPFCGIKKLYQGEEYLPAWCKEMKTPEPEIENTNQNINLNQPTNTNDSVGLANPAAVKCKKDGGTLESYQTAGGEDALCVFSDKSICNEWEYYRGDCTAGACFKVCKAIGTRSEGWYNSCSNELIKYEKCGDEESDKDIDDEDDTIKDQPVTQVSIKVFSPTENEQLSSPFKVEGQAIVKDNLVYIRVKNPAGNALIQETTTARPQAGTEWADFDIEINYEFNLTKEGTIEVYSLDDQDNEINLVSIPVKF